jgi:hypothetical protein
MVQLSLALQKWIYYTHNESMIKVMHMPISKKST